MSQVINQSVFLFDKRRRVSPSASRSAASTRSNQRRGHRKQEEHRMSASIVAVCNILPDVVAECARYMNPRSKATLNADACISRRCVHDKRIWSQSFQRSLPITKRAATRIRYEDKRHIVLSDFFYISSCLLNNVFIHPSPVHNRTTARPPSKFESFNRVVSDRNCFISWRLFLFKQRKMKKFSKCCWVTIHKSLYKCTRKCKCKCTRKCTQLH